MTLWDPQISWKSNNTLQVSVGELDNPTPIPAIFFSMKCNCSQLYGWKNLGMHRYCISLLISLSNWGSSWWHIHQYWFCDLYLLKKHSELLAKQKNKNSLVPEIHKPMYIALLIEWILQVLFVCTTNPYIYAHVLDKSIILVIGCVHPVE